MKIYNEIDFLLVYANKHLMLNNFDVIYFKNIIYDILDLEGTEEQRTSFHDNFDLEKTLNYITKDAVNRNVIDQNSELILRTKLMAILSLNPSEIEKVFNSFKTTKDATEWFYQYQINNDYIKINEINKNLIWHTKNTKTQLTITINLAKPEFKTTLSREKTKVIINYPKTVISKYNVGFKGSVTKNPRQNLRTIDVKLNNEDWFLQFSPYSYYNEHCIVINKNIVPMIINKDTFLKLFDFVDLYPHYFIGSNASLKRIGGSILNHEHFQGGGYVLPMQKQNSLVHLEHPEFPNLEISIVNWYSNTIRIKGKNKEEIINLSNQILNHWLNYRNEKLNIIPYTNNEKHHSLAPILRKDQSDYILDMILRSNYSNNNHPYGLFNTRENYFNIKSEAIGLIEAMGLFILPGRLKHEIDKLNEIIKNKDYTFNNGELLSHKYLIIDLFKKDYKDNTVIIKDRINLICEDILKDISVFKYEENGLKDFISFLNIIKIKEQTNV